MNRNNKNIIPDLVMKGVGSPVNRVVPQFSGQMYIDEPTRDIFIAVNTESNAWQILLTGMTQNELTGLLGAYVSKADVINDLTSDIIDKPLSANAGKLLKDELNGIQEILDAFGIQIESTNNLLTNAKDVIGAINEVKLNVDSFLAFINRFSEFLGENTDPIKNYLKVRDSIVFLSSYNASYELTINDQGLLTVTNKVAEPTSPFVIRCNNGKAYKFDYRLGQLFLVESTLKQVEPLIMRSPNGTLFEVIAVAGQDNSVGIRVINPFGVIDDMISNHTTWSSNKLANVTFYEVISDEELEGGM